MPGRTITHQKDLIFREGLRKLFQKIVHVNRVAIGQHQEKMVSSHGFHGPKGIIILPDMVTRHTWTMSFTAPASLRFIDSTKSCFILEHQSNLSFGVRLALFSRFQHALLNFFEASHASSFAAFGCLDRGITFRHPCRFNSR